MNSSYVAKQRLSITNKDAAHLCVTDLQRRLYAICGPIGRLSYCSTVAGAGESFKRGAEEGAPRSWS